MAAASLTEPISGVCCSSKTLLVRLLFTMDHGPEAASRKKNTIDLYLFSCGWFSSNEPPSPVSYHDSASLISALEILALKPPAPEKKKKKHDRITNIVTAVTGAVVFASRHRTSLLSFVSSTILFRFFHFFFSFSFFHSDDRNVYMCALTSCCDARIQK